MPVGNGVKRMKNRWCTIAAMVASLAVCAVACCAPADYQLRTIAVSSTVTVRVTLPLECTFNQPTYLNSTGEWKQLEITRSSAGTCFSLPRDALRSAVILCDRPAWLKLPDTDPPALKAVSVNGVGLDIAGGVPDAGRFGGPPKSIVFTVADELNPVCGPEIMVTFNGMPVQVHGGTVRIDQSSDGRSADIIITPGALPNAAYALSVTVPDATPRRNTLRAGLTFTTAPLLINGDFEQANSAGAPTGWRIAAWGVNAETTYETKVVKGAGRTGGGLKMTGIAGNIHLVVGQQVNVVPGNTYVFSGYYKTAGNETAFVSLFGKQEGELKQQYVTSPNFPAAADWTPFSWEVVPEPGHPLFEVFCCSKFRGDAYFDDLQLKPKQ